ncbi:aspartate-semialdehyde dehydrogenase [Synechocystis sp. PCC 7339]|uniref:aspartate-semialdehyde dehydrogenase n=1 Tax=unclassified Synechocystis TaxID=2640012 RepID=UPI001BAEBC49|nr:MULTISPECIES: aspartate-semialdehyde dehydrogenase [unclassified Synechocystis]QUS62214.1 aspartate-semialdehyde dehydrogenase [Synechocystis sp. PCC 7338]UAJ71398.1 aspartate-semialdehyde dehydrogenase [Synechocystis sp. PCC 7339]
MPSPIRVAILGATGAVGTELLGLLASRNFPLADLKLLASPRSVGKTLEFRGEKLPIQAVDGSAFKDCDLVLASAGGSTSKRWAEEITKAGAVMVDNSSAFRMVPEVPLVVPEINPEAAQDHQGIIANPNCTTILMGVAIYPLHQIQPIQRIVVATYQSASGAGAMAMEEVKHQSRDILAGKTPQAKILPYPLAFNLFPHNSPITANYYCEEEMKMVQETRKIFAAEEIRITATCVRVPVLRAHSEAVNLEFSTPFPVELAKTAIAKAPGVKLVEDWQKNYFPMPMDATGQDDVLVGRIRQDISHLNGLDLWLCGDQIRKGAALNAVQIAELLVERGWL